MSGVAGALIPSGGLSWRTKSVNKVVLLETEAILSNPAQPRKVFSEKEIAELAESIRANGLLQPLTVRRCEGEYVLVSGERRLRALRYANLKEAPCIVIDASDRQAALLALLENIQREDLNYFEEAAALQNLIVEWGLSQQELGARLGKAQPTIANKLRLLRFSPTDQQQMLAHEINERQARTLLRLEDSALLHEAINYIVEQKLNTAQTEQYVDRMLARVEEIRPKKRMRPIVKDVRLFFNTINKAILVMNQSGISASAEKIEKEDCIEYVVKIPLNHARF